MNNSNETTIINALMSRWTPKTGATLVLRKGGHNRTIGIAASHKYDVRLWSSRPNRKGEQRLIARWDERQGAPAGILDGWEISPDYPAPIGPNDLTIVYHCGRYCIFNGEARHRVNDLTFKRRRDAQAWLEARA